VQVQPVDLASYFARIGHVGNAAPTLETLRAIHLAHPAAIAFENLGPLTGEAVPLDLAALDAKLIRARRGGYCFEHNLLLKAVLEALGFTVTGLAARVLWGRPEGVPSPRTHTVLRVEAEGQSYIADVGFGGLTLTAPLRLDTDEPQDTPHGRFRLVRLDDDSLRLEAEVADAWRGLYHFDLTPYLQVDYELSNYYTATAPASPFVNTLMAARTVSDRRYALANGRLSVHHLDGPTERRELLRAADICAVLEEDFHIEVPRGPVLDQALARVLKG
jgi:N-hydroxyarylamine O-acetyltransferase